MLDPTSISYSNRYIGYSRTSTTVIGGYYFEEFLQSHSWFQPPEPQKFQSLPFCLPGGERHIQVPRLSKLDGVDESADIQRYGTAVVHSKGNLLTRDKESGLLTAIKVIIASYGDMALVLCSRIHSLLKPIHWHN